MQDHTHWIAYCGLYCGSCRKYIRGKCPGCRENTQATWCRIRTCNRQKTLFSCAECQEELSHCKKFNNFASRVIGLLMNSDRASCLRLLREMGPEAYADKMAREGKHTLHRRVRQTQNNDK